MAGVQKFSVLYGAYKPYKKHKEWTFDGILNVNGTTAILQNDDTAKQMGTATVDPLELVEGGEIVIGGYECQIQELLPNSVPTGPVEHNVQKEPSPESIPMPSIAVASVVSGVKRKFFSPLLNQNTLNGPLTARKRGSINVAKLFNQENCYALPRPPKGHYPEDKEIHDVYLTSHLTKVCRQHQLEGISFIYQCVMGYRETISGGSIEGSILADEMGLGKTLQCLALIYTLSRHGPLGKPVIKNTLVVVPSSLVNNWAKEFKRWIGSERMSVFIANKSSELMDYLKNVSCGKSYQVLVISYENFQGHSEKFSNIKFGLLLCDEGHRLKNMKQKTYTALHALDTTKRIILTGTPVQNDLEELYALAHFANPGIFGKYCKFQRLYEKPIMNAQEKHCSRSEKEDGMAASKELTAILGTFTLRRTNDTISAYLPGKTDYIICCLPTKAQQTAYNEIIHSNDARCLLNGVEKADASVFGLINHMKQVCNHPFQRRLSDQSDDDALSQFAPTDIEQSAKFLVVRDMLRNLKAHTTERVILVANFTKTLDLLQKMCDFEGHSYCRLDGNTSTAKRQEIVDSFNLAHSTTSGGVGLNLVGASRLVLFDLDWNPAHDLQAMARIWRDGQKRHVHIYRLLTTGTIEERIFQRQMKKDGLSNSLIDNNEGASKFSSEELKDLFSFPENVTSTTHDMLGCDCNLHRQKKEQALNKGDKSSQADSKFSLFGNTESTGSGDNDETASAENEKKPEKKEAKKGMAQLKGWEHISGDGIRAFVQQDVPKLFIESQDRISFVFKNEHKKNIEKDNA